MSLSTIPRRSSRLRPALLALAALAVGGMLAAGLSVPAFASDTVTVTVHLTDKSGGPVGDVAVVPYEMTDGHETSGYEPGDAQAQGAYNAGYYTLKLDPAKTYTLGFFIDKYTKNTFSEWLGGATLIDGAKTFSPATTTFVSQSLPANSTITGKVTGPTGSAEKSAFVEIYKYDGSSWFEFDNTSTTSSGVYTMTDLDPGSYRLEFYPSTNTYPPVFSGGASDIDSAASTYVASGKTATVNAKFTGGKGVITGTEEAIIDNDNTERVAKANPVAFPVLSEGVDVDGNTIATELDYDKSVYGTPSTSNGTWKISNLPTGDYVVQIEPYYYNQLSHYLTADRQVQRGLNDATIWHVVSGHTTATGTFTSLESGEDTGYVGAVPDITVTSGAAIAGASVNLVSDVDPYRTAFGTSDANGAVALFHPGNTSAGNIPVTENTDDGYPLTPGWYTVTVVAPGNQFEPFNKEEYFGLDGGQDSFPVPVSLVPVNTTSSISAVTLTSTGTTVGSSFTAAASAGRPTAKLTWEWFRGTSPDDMSVIYGATGNTYVATGADVGMQLEARAQAAEFGFDRLYSNSDPTDVITPGDAATNTAPPTISPSGTVHIGQTLTATPGAWTGSGWSYHYQWLSNGTDVGGDSSTYVVTKNDVSAGGTSLTVDVTATRSGYADGATATSATTDSGILLDAPTAKTQPTITKKTSGSNTIFTVKSGTWSVSGVTLSYSWEKYDSDTGILTPQPAGTGTTFSQPTSESDASPLVAVVTASRDGYQSGMASVIALKGLGKFAQDPDGAATVHVFHNGHAAGNAGGSDGTTILVGDSLSIAHGTWSSSAAVGAAPSGYKYTWTRGLGTPSAKVVSTSSTYTPTTSDDGFDLSLAETATSAGFADSAPALLDLGTIGDGTQLQDHPATVTVTGTAAPGLTLTGKAGSWPVSGVTNTYQWFSCGTTCLGSGSDTPIAGATTTKLVVPSDVDIASVYLQVTGSATHYVTGSHSSSPINIVHVKVVKAPTVSPDNTDSAVPKFSASAGTYSVTSGVVTYTWSDGTHSSEYDVNSTTPNVAVWVDVSYTVGTTTLTTHVVARRGLLTVDPNLSIVGANYGDTLSPSEAIPFTAEGSTLTAKYQWYYLSGSTEKSISGATKSTYVPTSTYVGKKLGVKISVTSPDYTTPSAVDVRMTTALGSEPFDATAPTVAPASPVDVGSVVTVTHGTGYPSSTTYSYQWTRDGVTISGATKSTYTTTSSDIGRSLVAVVTAKKTGYTTTPTPSAPVSVVAVPAPVSLTAPSIPSDGAVGQTLTASVGTWDATGLTYTYQWYRNEASADPENPGSAIPGATASTFTVPSEAFGDELSVRVTAHKGTLTSAPEESNVIVVGLGATPAPTTPLKITTSGGVYTVSTPTWTVDGLTFSYQWELDGMPADGNGSTTESFSQSGFGQTGELTVVVTAKRFGYPTVTQVPPGLAVTSR